MAARSEKMDSAPPCVLVTGSNRGIGLQLVKQYSAEGWRVLACCRTPETADELKKVAVDSAAGIVTLHKLDVGNPKDIATLKFELVDQPIDVLINNAAVLFRKEKSMHEVMASEMMESFRINTVAPLMVTRALIDRVKASEKKLVVVISSSSGSISENVDGDMWAYRASKVAVNSVFKCLALETEKDGVRVKLIHPGWVQTDMGYCGDDEHVGPTPDLTVKESVTGIMNVIADTKTKGMFFTWDGRPMSW